MTSALLEPRQLRYLERLRLRPRRKFSGSVRGERTTQARGVSIEFSDYREYAEGDDLRHLDWNVLARLGQAVTKTYRDEEDLALHLLVDTSASMSFGEPTKLAAACRLACALAYVGLAGGDTVYARALGTGGAPPRPWRGLGAYHRCAAWAGVLSAGSGRPLDQEITAFSATSARRGVVVLLSDGLAPGVTSALRLLAGRGHEVWFTQILSEPELDPDLEGDLRLLDSESSQAAEVTVNSFTLRAYRQALSEHNTSIQSECQRSGGRYALVSSDKPLEKVVNDVWKREGWLE